MAVSSITFPNKFKTLPNDDDKYVHIVTLNRGLKITRVKKILVPQGSFVSSNEFFNSLNYQLRKSGILNVTFEHTFYKQGQSQLKLGIIR